MSVNIIDYTNRIEKNRLGRCHHPKVEIADKLNKSIRKCTKLKSSYGKPILSRVVARSLSVHTHGVERSYTLSRIRDHRRVYGVIVCFFCDSFLLCQTILVIRLAGGQFVIEFAHIAFVVILIFSVIIVRLWFVLTYILFCLC